MVDTADCSKDSDRSCLTNSGWFCKQTFSLSIAAHSLPSGVKHVRRGSFHALARKASDARRASSITLSEVNPRASYCPPSLAIPVISASCQVSQEEIFQIRRGNADHKKVQKICSHCSRRVGLSVTRQFLIHFQENCFPCFGNSHQRTIEWTTQMNNTNVFQGSQTDPNWPP
ncbi:uncharacterized protein LOC124295044 [Neodiprion lecontei]|uniref:Uncharacterized protein LOC124295044 n=1 Tax=Neodiprion lecontei TaxID=441921 RepID=A0ABM3GFM1_NEOLC|nr:uncharacterized protein LOC124221616 [Neodiprion pinetum]XP_046599074.1 uncharacterized protein LOC124295044 [Neodiprion lecontei]